VYSWTVDIHERKQAEALLVRRDAQLAEAQALARLGSWEWDGDSDVMEWSVELYRLLGLDPTRSSATRQLFISRVHRDDRDALRLATNIARVEGSPFCLDVRFTRDDGAEGILLVRGRTTAGPSGGAARISGTAQDVTESRHLEATLRESEERFRRMFEESPAGVALVDAFLRIQKANGALSRMLGRPTSTLEGASLAEVTHPDDVEVVTGLTRRALTGAIPGYETESRLLCGDGSELWARLRASVVERDGDQAGYVLQIIEDISEDREADTAHRELDRLKDGFLRVVCHDLQNPLLTIAQLADLALAETCGAGLHGEVLGRIAAQAERLRQMVTRFMHLDCLYCGDVIVTRRPTDIAVLVERVVGRGDDRGHPLFVDVAPVVVAVDPEQLERIMENLLENALCHTPPGTPVWMRIEDRSGALHITVEDAGPGVPNELKAKIFELFCTGSGGSPRTGVGLWVVARLAELHGGRAWVEDRPGGGARFCAVLHVPGDAAKERAPAGAAAADLDLTALESSDLVFTVE
jgi:PAS domain S-box-containing protein